MRKTTRDKSCLACLICFLTIVAAWLSGCSDKAPNVQLPETIKPPSNFTEAVERETEKFAKVCSRELENKKMTFSKHMADHAFITAYDLVMVCASILKESEYNALAAQATLSIALDSASLPQERHLAIERLEKSYPRQFSENLKEIELARISLVQAEKTDKINQKRAANQEISRRKNEGVSLGMTEEEVKASSWGKPRSINRTTGTYGTHEQWTYGGQNYLYFENGRLTTIQN